MDDIIEYIPTERKAIVGTKEVTVRNLRPVFKDTEEREHATQRVQDGLYRVFRKYVGEDAS